MALEKIDDIFLLEANERAAGRRRDPRVPDSDAIKRQTSWSGKRPPKYKLSWKRMP